MIIIDKLSYSSGLAHVSPEEKFAYAVLTLLVCVVSRSVTAAVIVLAVNGILNVKKGRVPFYLYLKYLMVPLIFLLLSTLAILVNVSKEPLDAYAIPLGQYYVCDIQLDGAEKRRADDTDCACKCFQSVCPVF